MKTKHTLTIQEAATLLRSGEVVAFPTETVYGLGADATRDTAIEKIYAAKGRPGDNPLIVHIGDVAQLDQVVSELPDRAKKLMDAFWPGALTIILPRQEGVSDAVTAGLETVGVRMPSHPVALELLRAVKLPIAAPSANVSGRPSPTTAQHVADDLDGKIAGILDGGAVEIGVESTVIDCTTDPPVIFRPGGVTKAEIEAVIGPVVMAQPVKNADFAPKSPGMKYTHYAPDAPMAIIQGSDAFFQRVIDDAQRAGKRVGLLVTEEHRATYTADVILTCGNGQEPLSIAQNLYAALRAFNEHDIDVIYSESFADTGLGEAVMNRLLKASGHRVIREDLNQTEGDM
ncbi:MAG: L-threonylcarbamoyladenylate synthase [Oscillospiraceae bacterium]|nr:L-threonylcarbamoyladenylate synthase [Oscillospiraceae bacterium]